MAFPIMLSVFCRLVLALARQNMNTILMDGALVLGAFMLAFGGRTLLAWVRDEYGRAVVNSLDEGLGKDVTRIQEEVAYEFKAKFGELKYNKANQIIAGEFVRNHWRETRPDMRARDIAMHYPLAVELCLLPLRGAVEAQRLAQRRAVVGRRAAVQLPK